MVLFDIRSIDVSLNGTHCSVLGSVYTLDTDVCDIACEILYQARLGDKVFPSGNVHLGGADFGIYDSMYSVANK